MNDLLTLSDLQEITGQKARPLQLWTDAKILMAQAGTDRQGRGVHRRYSRIEGIIALIMSEISKYKMSTALMIELSEINRSLLDDAVVFSGDIASIGENRSSKRHKMLFSYIVHQALTMNKPAFEAIILGNDEDKWDSVTIIDDALFSRQVEDIFGSEGWFKSIGAAFDNFKPEENRCGIIINLASILHPRRHHFI